MRLLNLLSSAFVTHGVVSERYSIKKLSESEFTISISEVTVKDGGNYTCFHYDHHVTEKTVELTVLGENAVVIFTATVTVNMNKTITRVFSSLNSRTPQINTKKTQGKV